MSKRNIKRGKELLRGFFKRYTKGIQRMHHKWRTGYISDVLDRMELDTSYYTEVLCATVDTVLQGAPQPEKLANIAPIAYTHLCNVMNTAVKPYTLICNRNELCELIKLVAVEMQKQAIQNESGETKDVRE